MKGKKTEGSQILPAKVANWTASKSISKTPGLNLTVIPHFFLFYNKVSAAHIKT